MDTRSNSNWKQEIKDLWHIWSIWSVYLSISFAKIGLNVRNRPQCTESASMYSTLRQNQRAVHWGRFRTLRPILYIEAKSLHAASMYSLPQFCARPQISVRPQISAWPQCAVCLNFAHDLNVQSASILHGESNLHAASILHTASMYSLPQFCARPQICARPQFCIAASMYSLPQFCARPQISAQPQFCVGPQICTQPQFCVWPQCTVCLNFACGLNVQSASILHATSNLCAASIQLSDSASMYCTLRPIPYIEADSVHWGQISARGLNVQSASILHVASNLHAA